MLTVFQQGRQRPFQRPLPLGYDHAILPQQPPNLIHQPGTPAHGLLTQPVRQQPVGLLNTARHNTPQLRTTGRLTNRQGIMTVGLVPLYKRLHMLRWNQLHLIAPLLQLTTPVIRTPARLHRHYRIRVTAHKGQQTRTPYRPVKHRLAGLIHSTHLKK